MLAFLASALTSTLTSISPGVSWRGAPDSFAGLLTLGAYGVLFFAARALLTRGEDARHVLAAAVLAGSVASAYALVQAAGADPLPWSRTLSFQGLLRVFGTLGHPTLLGGYLALTLPLSAWLAFEAARRGARRELVFWSAAGLLQLAALVATVARAALVAAACAALVLLFALVRARAEAATGRRLARGALALALSALLLLMLAPRARRATAALGARALHTLVATPSAPREVPAWRDEPRLLLWQAALRLWRQHPWLGHGLDTFALAYPPQRQRALWRVEGQRTPQKAHDELLHVLATQGALGGLTLLALGLAWAAALRRAAQRQPAERALLAALAASSVALAVHGAFGFVVAALGALAAVSAGVVAGLAFGARRTPPETDVVPAPLIAACALGAAGLLAALVVAPLRADRLAQQGRRLERARPGTGLALMERACALDPGRAWLWMELGRARSEAAWAQPRGTRGALAAAAQEAFERARGLVDRDPYAHLGLARASSVLAAEPRPSVDPATVFRAFERALQLDPRNPYVAADAARVGLELRDRARARTYAGRCLEAEPDYGPCRHVLARLEIMAAFEPGRAQDEARRLMASAAARIRDALSLRWDGATPEMSLAAAQASALLAALGRVHEALELGAEAVRLDENSLDARLNLARAYEQAGARVQAAAQYREALRLAPDHAAARAGLARVSP